MDGVILDGLPDLPRTKAWRYPEVYGLDPGQSVFYRSCDCSWESLRNLGLVMRKRGWHTSVRKVQRGIWFLRLA